MMKTAEPVRAPSSNWQRSYLEASARQRVHYFFDQGSVQEFLPPEVSQPSSHLAALGVPGAFDDGVMIGQARLAEHPILFASQEGQFMGGSVGEIHGAKLVGLLQRALIQRPKLVVLMIDSGGVRLHEANAGLIAISEVMRAVLQVRQVGIPVLALVGGSCGAFGGMGIVSKLCSAVLMSDVGRLALSGPEVIETVQGVEEFDSKDRALVWRVTGGKNRYLMKDCWGLVEDSIEQFRDKSISYLQQATERGSTLTHLKQTNQRLQQRCQDLKALNDGLAVWEKMGISNAQTIPSMDVPTFLRNIAN